MPEKNDEVACCGLYCPGCGLYQNASGTIESFLGILKSYDIDRPSDHSVSDDYSSSDGGFQQVLYRLSRSMGPCSGCQTEDKEHDCEVRTCVKDRGYQTCLECIRMENCTQLDPRTWARNALREIRDEGYENWIKTKREMVEAGWSYLNIFD
ncbi:MAG: DUF3795 domain-containing protein [Candidatus Hodarchaeota archaeon]